MSEMKEMLAKADTLCSELEADQKGGIGEPRPEPVECDRLDRLFDLQRVLNDFTFAKGKEDTTFSNLAAMGEALKHAREDEAFARADQDKLDKWVQRYTLAMRQECAELMDSTNWKWWKKNTDEFDAQNIGVELIDIFHFFMSACMVMGIGPDDLVRMYVMKNRVNIDRQVSGYIVKDEDDSRHVK